MIIMLMLIRVTELLKTMTLAMTDEKQNDNRDR